MHWWLTTLIAITSFLPISTQDYTIYHTGSDRDTITSPLGGICMMGGRRENDEAMKWFLNRADGGDIVILRASGSDGYNNYFYSQLGMNINSVTSIVFHNRQASFNDTIQKIVSNAEAIWMAGGNQWKYVQYWRGTPIDSIINYNLEHKNISIGGTSAGMAVLGSIYFSARKGTISSEECLLNPLTEKITIDTAQFFNIPVLNHVITDTHYDERNRQGRHAIFMVRTLIDYNMPVYGIACDEYTSLCIDNHGIARAYGDYPGKDDQVYFLKYNDHADQIQPFTRKEDNSFDWNEKGPTIQVYMLPGTLDGSYSFNLNNWKEGIGGKWFEWKIIDKKLVMNQRM